MQTLLIILGISFLGILVMIYRGVSHVRNTGFEHGETAHPIGKHFARFWNRVKITLTYIAHSIAVFVSKIWARISHRVFKIRRKIVNKVEDYFKHKNENNLNKDAKTQSILLTTIKAYKKEIKKLKQTIEPDDMKPRNETTESKTRKDVDIS